MSEEKKETLRDVINLTPRQFDTNKLPNDLGRVYEFLKNKYDEEYALLVVFTMRTAMELHRAWHMTLLTSKILQQIKDKHTFPGSQPSEPPKTKTKIQYKIVQETYVDKNKKV